MWFDPRGDDQLIKQKHEVKTNYRVYRLREDTAMRDDEGWNQAGISSEARKFNLAMENTFKELTMEGW
jgi:hypothetical protein